MKTISSSDFRKTYASLTEPVVVTVNGHGVGTWQPWRGDFFEASENAAESMRDISHSTRDPVRFNTVPFRGPIPKVRGSK